ncbi:MAG: Recombination protein RecR [candidate division WS2 bacterium ADurb.Bin280]|uniref:Recombination protein RecR n=1 Tax=candidate division WS2 bacterium ADurb.Bin280 TaxID=1852829 RepID=A0A1V5SDB0_9BACT|nr:MAG: Recombination protein RecR [candidate division WS2 bacterium ADurb.Bin280]
MLPKAVQNLIEEFSRLPGIGPKSAARLVFYLLSRHKDDVKNLSVAIERLLDDLVTCKSCFNIADSDPCEICLDENRNRSALCVVEDPLDVISLERAGFDGLYHVLGGVISPINGIGPDDLRIGELIKRLRMSDKIKEVILATNPSLEGEATAVYISDKLSQFDIKITRLARGLPMGGDLEYADELTLSRALEGRKEF